MSHSRPPQPAPDRGGGHSCRPVSDDSAHQCFTVDSTSYLRNLYDEDLRGPCIAVHYQKPPTKTETGTSIGLRFPMLIMALYLEKPDEVAQRVADILNKHWDDFDQVPASREGER
ncbi:hypothetical protein G432_05030 [Sphingomonas sp. MM-1]|nr:hypothetical protein G432_05030 [Sphingomonas sp. MM-1]